MDHRESHTQTPRTFLGRHSALRAQQTPPPPLPAPFGRLPTTPSPSQRLRAIAPPPLHIAPTPPRPVRRRLGISVVHPSDGTRPDTQALRLGRDSKEYSFFEFDSPLSAYPVDFGRMVLPPPPLQLETDRPQFSPPGSAFSAEIFIYTDTELCAGSFEPPPRTGDAALSPGSYIAKHGPWLLEKELIELTPHHGQDSVIVEPGSPTYKPVERVREISENATPRPIDTIVPSRGARSQRSFSHTPPARQLMYDALNMHTPPTSAPAAGSPEQYRRRRLGSPISPGSRPSVPALSELILSELEMIGPLDLPARLNVSPQPSTPSPECYPSIMEAHGPLPSPNNLGLDNLERQTRQDASVDWEASLLAFRQTQSEKVKRKRPLANIEAITQSIVERKKSSPIDALGILALYTASPSGKLGLSPVQEGRLTQSQGPSARNLSVNPGPLDWRRGSEEHRTEAQKIAQNWIKATPLRELRLGGSRPGTADGSGEPSAKVHAFGAKRMEPGRKKPGNGGKDRPSTAPTRESTLPALPLELRPKAEPSPLQYPPTHLPVQNHIPSSTPTTAILAFPVPRPLVLDQPAQDASVDVRLKRQRSFKEKAGSLFARSRSNTATSSNGSAKTTSSDRSGPNSAKESLTLGQITARKPDLGHGLTDSGVSLALYKSKADAVDGPSGQLGIVSLLRKRSLRGLRPSTADAVLPVPSLPASARSSHARYGSSLSWRLASDPLNSKPLTFADDQHQYEDRPRVSALLMPGSDRAVQPPPALTGAPKIVDHQPAVASETRIPKPLTSLRSYASRPGLRQGARPATADGPTPPPKDRRPRQREVSGSSGPGLR